MVDIPSTLWVDALKSTVEFGLVSLSIDMGHIWSWHAYSYEKGYAGVTLLFCRSLGPYIKAPVEHAVWNLKRGMCPVTYLGALIMPMVCEFHSVHEMGPHRSAYMVVRGVGAHSGLAHWACIPYICVISTSSASLSFSVTVLVFHSQFSVFCYPFSMVSLHNITLILF